MNIKEDGESDFLAANSIFRNHGVTKFAVEVLAGDDKQDPDPKKMDKAAEVQKLYYGDKANQIASIDQEEINKQLDTIEKKWKDDRRRAIKGRDKSMQKERSGGYLKIEPESETK